MTRLREAEGSALARLRRAHGVLSGVREQLVERARLVKPGGRWEYLLNAWDADLALAAQLVRLVMPALDDEHGVPL